MEKTKLLSNAILMSMLMSTSVLWGGTALAAEDIQEYALDTMVVTATRTEKTVQDTPANVTVITQKELKDSGYQSVFQAVRELSQANCHTYQEDGGDYGGMMSRIRVRGIDDGTLVLVNGNPSNYMNHATLNTVPMDQIEKIEIVKGSNSVLVRKPWAVLLTLLLKDQQKQVLLLVVLSVVLAVTKSLQARTFRQMW